MFKKIKGVATLCVMLGLKRKLQKIFGSFWISEGNNIRKRGLTSRQLQGPWAEKAELWFWDWRASWPCVCVVFVYSSLTNTLRGVQNQRCSSVWLQYTAVTPLPVCILTLHGLEKWASRLSFASSFRIFCDRGVNHWLVRSADYGLTKRGVCDAVHVALASNSSPSRTTGEITVEARSVPLCYNKRGQIARRVTTLSNSRQFSLHDCAFPGIEISCVCYSLFCHAFSLFESAKWKNNLWTTPDTTLKY
jgi:hypothetical protein